MGKNKERTMQYEVTWMNMVFVVQRTCEVYYVASCHLRLLAAFAACVCVIGDSWEEKAPWVLRDGNVRILVCW